MLRRLVFRVAVAVYLRDLPRGFEGNNRMQFVKGLNVLSHGRALVLRHKARASRLVDYQAARTDLSGLGY